MAVLTTRSIWAALSNQLVNVGTLLAPDWQIVTKATSRTLSSKVSAAQINAGYTLLPAVPGYKYRLIDAYLVAIGGAVTGPTTIDINGTQAAALVKLLSVAIAALTQNAVVRAGAANATVLAGGASFDECDVNTPITVTRAGTDISVATHVDVNVTYEMIKA
jgi:hypothetical protein